MLPCADRIARSAALSSAALALAGCNTEQSALAPHGPHAEAVHTLNLVMTVSGTAIFLLVLVLLALAIVLPPERRRWIGGRGIVVALGIGLPVVALTALLAYGLTVMGALATAGPPQLRIRVTGHMWWWRVDYLDPSGASVLTTANEIRVPVGVPVEYVLETADVIHSFWVPSLAGKLDMIPGRTNRLVFSAGRPGVYRGQCAEYCGDQHALMAFKLVALSRDDFEAWYAREAGPAAEPRGRDAVAGKALFESLGCGGCHTVRGTTADGDIGPDLTHVGSRLTIAAGSHPRNIGTLAGWVASAQHLKPGNAMPSFDRLSGPDLIAVAAYLESLK